jgi:hypothetical protein
VFNLHNFDLRDIFQEHDPGIKQELPYMIKQKEKKDLELGFEWHLKPLTRYSYIAMWCNQFLF